jgi:Tfp pilus assembly protein PilO
MNKGLIASLIFAAGAFAFFVLVLPEFDSLSNARAALETRQSLLEETTAELKRVAELEEQYKSRQADIDKLAVMLPEQKRIDEVVSSIQQITSQTGLTLTVLTTAGSAETGESTGYKKIFVSFDVSGQYPSFINFLKLLEQSLRLYDVFEIIGSLIPNPTGTAQNLVNFTVKLNAYNLK